MPLQNNEIPKAEATTKPKLRVERVHGGRVVEEIEKPTLINNPSCEHHWVIDPTEVDFIAYVCDKPDCGVAKIFDK